MSDNKKKRQLSSWAEMLRVKKATKKGKSTQQKKDDIKKKLKKQCLLLAKQIVYKRDKNICQHCKELVSWSNRHASHVIPVSRWWRLALEPLNMKVLCYHCHLNWRHKHPIESGERYTTTFPERWKRLKQKYIDTPMWSITLSRLEEHHLYLLGLDAKTKI